MDSVFLVKITEQTGLQSSHFICLVTPSVINNPALSSTHPHYETLQFNREIGTPPGGQLKGSDAAGSDRGAGKSVLGVCK